MVENVQRAADYYRAPTDQVHGLREFRVQAPDGYILAFGKRMS